MDALADTVAEERTEILMKRRIKDWLLIDALADTPIVEKAKILSETLTDLKAETLVVALAETLGGKNI